MNIVEKMYHYVYCPARYVYMSIYLMAKKINKKNKKYIETLHTMTGLVCNYMSPSA